MRRTNDAAGHPGRAETMAGQIARLVDSAPVGDTRMQNHAERFADRLVLPTLGLAVSTALLTRDFNRFLSLVIIDYGTGIRVAAPTAVLASMTNAARKRCPHQERQPLRGQNKTRGRVPGRRLTDPPP